MPLSFLTWLPQRMVAAMDILLNGLRILTKGELTIVAVLHDGKNDVTSMSPFGC